MKESVLPTSIQMNGQQVRFSQLHNDFSRTPYGETLKANIRYAPFKPQDMLNSLWEKTLGADVNNLDHLHLSLGMTRVFLSLCANPPKIWKRRVPKNAVFTPDEQRLLLFTAIVHDWAEAVIGDIPAPAKTQSDEALEMLTLRNIMNGMLEKKSRRVEREGLISDVQKVLTDKTSKTGMAFYAIEGIGYMRTGLRAWQESQQATGELKQNLVSLAKDVVPRQAQKLIRYAVFYPPVYSYLFNQQEPITQVVAISGDGSQKGWTSFIKNMSGK